MEITFQVMIMARTLLDIRCTDRQEENEEEDV